MNKEKITEGKIKPNHPMEFDYRIPKELRRHFDAEWQINLVLGCKYLEEIQKIIYHTVILITVFLKEMF